MGYQGTTGATSRKINLYFTTHKIVIQGVNTGPARSGVRINRAVRTPERTKEGGAIGENKVVIDGKRYKTNELHVKQVWSLCLSG